MALTLGGCPVCGCERRLRVTERNDLSVGRRVAIGAGTVTCDGNQLIGDNDTGANRHFIASAGIVGSAQGFAHPALVLLQFRATFLSKHFLQIAKLRL